MTRNALPFFALSLLACSSSASPTVADPPQLQDISAAPAAIQKAASAVVRVATAGEVATGSFISSTGLLLTNNHVLGVPVCPVEGCSVTLRFDYQHGKPVAPATTAFAVPVAVDAGLDVAVVQMYASANDTSGGELSTPSYLTLRPLAASALERMHVTIVGHPEGHVKKWSSGTVVDWSGDWFTSSAFILPGDSGSPVLDDEGRIVGIIHRSPTGEDLVTGDGYDVSSVGTASGPISDRMNAPLPTAMMSVTADTTADQVVANDRVYLNARTATASMGGGTTSSVLSLLGQACDAVLARTSFASPDDLSTSLQPCYDAMLWIECRADATPAAYGTVCPIDVDQAAWSQRFQAINARWQTMNGTLDLAAVSFALASLSTSKAAGQSTAASSLQQVLGAAHAPLDLTVSNYLAAFGVTSYAGAELATYVKDYKDVPGYAIDATDAASTAGWLAGDGVLGRDDVIGILQSLEGDESVPTATKLYIDDLLYEGGVDP